MIDVRLFAQALKLSWVKKYLDKGNEAKWKLFFNVQLRDLVKHLVITVNKNASQESINYESFLDTFLKAKNTNKIVYRKLIEKKRKQPVNSQTKWSADCMIEKNEPIDWKAACRLPFECTKISKLRVFQFKLLHRRLATNDFLKKIKISAKLKRKLSSIFSGTVR